MSISESEKADYSLLSTLGILNDDQIIQLGLKGMITPFVEGQVRTNPSGDDATASVMPYDDKVISYGTGSFGYDARLGTTFKVFSDTHCIVMDPKHPNPQAFVDIDTQGSPLIIPPHGYVLGHTVEIFDLPDNIVMICIGKSTYARSGLLINVTPGEPEWRGMITLELANLLPIPLKVYPNEGICQFLFWRGLRPKTTYADRNGKYQDQRGVVLPRL